MIRESGKTRALLMGHNLKDFIGSSFTAEISSGQKYLVLEYNIKGVKTEELFEVRNGELSVVNI